MVGVAALLFRGFLYLRLPLTTKEHVFLTEIESIWPDCISIAPLWLEIMNSGVFYDYAIAIKGCTSLFWAFNYLKFKGNFYDGFSKDLCIF